MSRIACAVSLRVCTADIPYPAEYKMQLRPSRKTLSLIAFINMYHASSHIDMMLLLIPRFIYITRTEYNRIIGINNAKIFPRKTLL